MKKLNVMVVGSGGREHALVWKIMKSQFCEQIYCLSELENPGITAAGAKFVNVVLSRNDLDLIVAQARELGIDLVVVGPEAPLARGLADELAKAGILCFGPAQAVACIESSKVWSKHHMAKYMIPTAAWAFFSKPDEARKYILAVHPEGNCVVKADGLCAGKGAIVCHTLREAMDAIDLIMVEREFGDSGEYVIVEEKLSGPELSILAVTDGRHIVVLPPSQDHKPIGEGDTGANTGGMGAYSPVPSVDDALLDEIIKTILRPAIIGMEQEECPYRGVLYAGLMLVDGKPFVIEFNCRFGDPETQAVLPVVGEDILPLLYAAAKGELKEDRIIPANGAALCVVIASGGYPDFYKTGKAIYGLDRASGYLGDNGFVFHAGTVEKDDNIYTAGGRVLGITGFGRNLQEAAVRANGAAGLIQFEGAYRRKDIGFRALKP